MGNVQTWGWYEYRVLVPAWECGTATGGDDVRLATVSSGPYCTVGLSRLVTPTGLSYCTVPFVMHLNLKYVRLASLRRCWHNPYGTRTRSCLMGRVTPAEVSLAVSLARTASYSRNNNTVLYSCAEMGSSCQALATDNHLEYLALLGDQP